MQVSYWWIKQRNGTCYQTTISYFYLSFCFYELILKLIPCSNSFFIPLPVLFFFHAHFSLAPLRARVWYNNVSFSYCFLAHRPHARNMFYNIVMHQHFSKCIQKYLEKIVEYIWSVYQKGVLLHPLSKRRKPWQIDLVKKWNPT